MYARLHATVRSTVEPLVVLLTSRALCINVPVASQSLERPDISYPVFFKDENRVMKK